MRALFALVRDFEEAYAAEKRRRGVLDFSDLEHRTVELLVGPDGPTELAGQLSGRYAEIMVDEYQDTNEVQNAIFSALSRAGKNLFLVGDVKQSIYRFRLADPTIFLEKYRTFPSYEYAREGESRRINLSKNFRSRPEVLEGGNFLFRNLMSVEFGEMDYTPEEFLYPGPDFPEIPNPAVELDALDLSGEDEEERPAEERAARVSRDLQEARFAARRIRALLDEGFPVGDGKGGVRPAEPSDIVILLRSPNTVLPHYARALAERGVPWEADGGGLLCLHRSQCGPLAPPDRGQSPAGRAPHLGPALPGVRLYRRPAGPAAGGLPGWRLLPGGLLRGRAGGRALPRLPGGTGGAALRRGRSELLSAALAAV